ncbi:MAG: DegT/DnrJ/EryC1/StrS family aminotransferase [Opitutae bacterium]|nr:DegT/DnrJ/EryC1/StrS family aminotransferase [Opitutae bacterium]
MLSGHYILGHELEAFEKEFSAWLGATDTVGVGNGTDAIELALLAAGIGPGDKVVREGVSNVAFALQGFAYSWFGQSLAALRLPYALLGALEVFFVYLLGKEVGGKKAGTWGQLASFSFYPTKNLGAYGDAGAVTGRDPVLLEKVRLLRQYGWRKRYVSDLNGRNSRLDELQAAILRVRLARLDAENGRRNEMAGQYLTALKDTPLRLPVTAEGRTHTWHQFVVRTPKRDELQAHLAKKDIVCGVLYPVPIHRQPAYHDATLSLPQTEQACAEVLSLPLHPGLKDDDVARVAREVKGFFEPAK